MKKRTVIPPVGGWEARTWYLVHISGADNNPIHLSLFYSGFLTNGQPGGYNGAQPINYAGDGGFPFHAVRYLKVLKKLISVDEAEKEFPISIGQMMPEDAEARV